MKKIVRPRFTALCFLQMFDNLCIIHIFCRKMIIFANKKNALWNKKTNRLQKKQYRFV